MNALEAVAAGVEMHRRRIAREEPVKPKRREPLPSREDAWKAWCTAAIDRDETPDREAFDAWWAGT